MDTWERASQEWGTKDAETLWEPLKCAEEIARRPSMAGDSGQVGAWWEVSLERAGGWLGKDFESHCKNPRVYAKQDGSHWKMLNTGAT